MKQSYIFILLMLSCYLSRAQAPSTCFEIQSILVDACGSPEGENEMVRFIVGPNDLNVATLNITWPNNGYLGICQNAQTAANVDTLNGTIASCGHIVEPVGGILPAGASVLLVTSVNMNPNFNSFAGLTDTLYMIFQCAGNTQGHFKNYAAGSGYRTLEMDFGPLCSDTVTYSVDSLVDQSGIHAAQDGATVNFDFNGVDTYTNPGCQAPIVPLNASLQSSADTICAGDTIQVAAIINSGNFTSFFWTGGMGSFDNASGLNSGYFSNTGFSGTDLLIFGIVGVCGDTLFDSLLVFVNNGGSITLSASGPVTFCQGDSVILTASGATNYLWNNGATTSSITVVNPGNYIVSGTGGCGSAVDSILVTVLNDNTIDLSLNGPDTICFGDSLVLAVINGGSAFMWSTGNTTASISVFSTGTYNVTVTGQCGILTFSQQVQVNTIPVISVTVSDSVLCKGETALLSATGGNSYVWSDGRTTASISISTPGNYSVISENSCGKDSVYVSVNGSLIHADFTTDKDSGAAPLTVQFTDQSTGATSWFWEFGDNGTSTDSSPDHTFSNPGSYQVLLITEDANGCRDSAFALIIVKEDSMSLQVPNVFSPNGDGFNPYFNVKGTGIKSISGKIYNRWGNEIGNWNSIDKGWDGNTKNGTEAAPGAYFFTLEVTFNSNRIVKRQGHLTLIR